MYRSTSLDLGSGVTALCGAVRDGEPRPGEFRVGIQVALRRLAKAVGVALSPVGSAVLEPKPATRNLASPQRRGHTFR
jgi:hypothetical protein